MLIGYSEFYSSGLCLWLHRNAIQCCIWNVIDFYVFTVCRVISCLIMYWIVIVDVSNCRLSTCLAASGDVTSVRYTSKTSRYTLWLMLTRWQQCHDGMGAGLLKLVCSEITKIELSGVGEGRSRLRVMLFAIIKADTLVRTINRY